MVTKNKDKIKGFNKRSMIKLAKQEIKEWKDFLKKLNDN